MSPFLFAVPGIPNTPDLYAKVHPDRVKKFPSSGKKLFIDTDEDLIINPKKLMNKSPDDKWRQGLEHDTESVFWLLLYWAMVVQPEKCSKEKIDAASWADLNGSHVSRQNLLFVAGQGMTGNLTHSVYRLLRPLINDLAANFVIDGHWLPVSDLRKDPFYIIEAFQRLILNFIIDNRGKEFMDHPIEKTFREVREVQGI